MRKPEELDILKRLEKLQAVVKTFRRDKPFLIRVPLQIWPEVSDEELGELMRPFWAAHPKMSTSPSIEPQPSRLSDAERRFLMHVANNPHSFTSQHYNGLNLSLASGTRLRQKLVDAGHLRIHPIPTGRPGRIPEILELTESGYRELDLARPNGSGHGSFEHSWWAHQVKAWVKAQANSEVVIEKFINGKSVDVGERTEMGWVAWEIQLPDSVRPHLIADLIAKDLNAGFIRIVLCVFSSKDKERVDSAIVEMEKHPELFKLPTSVADRVSIRLLADFVHPDGGKSS